MKVLNLRCAHEHRFEGWFASEEAFGQQTEDALIECPVCGDRDVSRLPTAPRLNVAHLRATEPTPPDPSEQAQAHWMNSMRKLLTMTDDVGERFAVEARRIHYGEARDRGIRGVASRDEADDLRDEGIDIFVLPVTPALKGPLQ